ncbi:hypothetical protein D3C73_1084560 [compost metagenome]
MLARQGKQQWGRATIIEIGMPDQVIQCIAWCSRKTHKLTHRTQIFQRKALTDQQANMGALSVFERRVEQTSNVHVGEMVVFICKLLKADTSVFENASRGAPYRVNYFREPTEWTCTNFSRPAHS